MTCDRLLNFQDIPVFSLGLISFLPGKCKPLHWHSKEMRGNFITTQLLSVLYINRHLCLLHWTHTLFQAFQKVDLPLERSEKNFCCYKYILHRFSIDRLFPLSIFPYSIKGLVPISKVFCGLIWFPILLLVRLVFSDLLYSWLVGIQFSIFQSCPLPSFTLCRFIPLSKKPLCHHLVRLQ